MMDTRTDAQIFLADQRGCTQTEVLRSYHTFNFGQYSAEGREPFGALCLLNDDILRPEASLTMQVEQPVQVVLLPIVGGLEFVSAGETHFLEPGQAGVLSLDAGMGYSVTNPYPAESVNYIQLWFAQNQPDSAPSVSQVEFNLATQNTLLPFIGNPASADGRDAASPASGQAVPEQAACSGFIGRFAGREEGTYAVGPVTPGITKRVFAFVLQGVFEIANRLLHEKDGLALTYQQADVLEFEALSNDALLVILTC